MVTRGVSAYVIWVTVGGQTIVGWPRVVQIIPASTNANVSSMRPESDTMALASELVRHGGNDMSLIDALGRQSTDVDKLRVEMMALRERLAGYERAEHKVQQRGADIQESAALAPAQVEKLNDKVMKLIVHDSESDSDLDAARGNADDNDEFGEALDQPDVYGTETEED